MLSVTPLATVFPSFSHVIFGAGLPVAVQWNVAMVASLTVWSVGWTVMLGVTGQINNALIQLLIIK